MGSILQALHINSTLLAQLVDFILLFAFLRIFAWPPLLQAMERRRKNVEEHLAAAEGERQEAVRYRDEQQKALAEARAQAQEILERSRRAADEQARQLLEQAQAAAVRQREEARAEISRERDRAVVALRQEVADLVVEAASKLVRARLDDAGDRRLVEEFVASVNAQAGGER